MNEAKHLAMEITECGTHLCDLLKNEETVHNQRKKTVNFLDTVFLSSAIQDQQVRGWYIRIFLHIHNAPYT